MEHDAIPDKTSRRVLSYFVRNADACDSVEGLVRWQLLEDAIVERMRETEAALRHWVDEGYLIEERRPGTVPLYRMNADRQAEALELLDRIASLAPQQGNR